MILTYVVAVEAGSNSYTANIAISQSSEISFCFSNFTRPSTFFRFSAPRYLYRLMCTGEICTASERDRYDKSMRTPGQT
ncbi:hypothetical protein K7X08_003813 [Anisodus acutangulus]|uniref:Uncharacterized protein n=1 Tax=Anisodus acutangulus TaxID=402998 RepID=A0A9Q1RJR3_9SOLA|nr:hypothetical protein K7X08_003813 [Anisodus acutangulus]